MNPHVPVPLWPDRRALGPITDLYQITMMAGYLATGKAAQRASFELFVRRLPPHRAYLVFAGLEQAVGDLLALAFSAEQIEGLRRVPSLAHADPAFFDWLATLRFEGDVWAMPEGTVVFPGETLLRVTAPLAQAQWVETFLLASLSYTTLVASKAARIATASRGRTLFEFGARRGHGPQTGLLAARAAYLAGFHGTSHAEAARLLGIPASGTMAHSWVQSFLSEEEAFAAYARGFPGFTTLLIDTYDTLEGARKAAAIDPPVQGVRLDSGDIATLAHQVRAILDQRDRKSVRIMASGDLDEYQIERMLAAGAPIDGFGIGTELITSRDAPALSMVYKLVEIEGHGRFKLSPGKKTYPMAKQVYRQRDRHGFICGDLVTRADEVAPGDPLLVPIVRAGKLTGELPTLEAIRAHCTAQVAMLPEHLKRLDAEGDYPVTYSDQLEADAKKVMEQGGG
jgi:nicotinate phosphoribosyltransferase